MGAALLSSLFRGALYRKVKIYCAMEFAALKSVLHWFPLFWSVPSERSIVVYYLHWAYELIEWINYMSSPTWLLILL